MKTSVVYSMNASEYNHKLANLLKDMPEFVQPEWAHYVKSSVSKKRPPQDPDFWFKRASSILRQIYVRKAVGVNRLKTRYGGLKNRGMKPEKFRKGSGKMIRVLLQQSEQAGLLEKINKVGHASGRQLTEKGKKLMESIK